MEKTLVAGVIGWDAHVIGLRVLEYALRKAGFKVIDLGIFVSQREFIEAAVEANADAILVSSLYGHGYIDCMGFRQKCEEAGLNDILLYVGGNLVPTSEFDWENTERLFKEEGFDRVYPSTVPLTAVINDLRRDLKMNRTTGE